MRLSLASLRAKILLGYVVIGLLILTLSVVAYGDLGQLQRGVRLGAHVTDFLNVSLELRRYEKNYFLYRDASDLEAFRRWLLRARGLFQEHLSPVDWPDLPERSLVETIRAYSEAMERLARLSPLSEPGERARLENAVRLHGRRLVTAAESLSDSEMQLRFAILDSHRQAVLVTVALMLLVVPVVGLFLGRVVTRPLEAIERTMRLVAQGHLGPIALVSRDREVLSLTLAFNRMLQELQSRQAHLVRSEKMASLGTLLSGVAHELNNPLSNIATSCQILLEEPELPPFQREMLAQIDQQTLRARDIVLSVLNYSRHRPFQREEVVVDLLIAESVRLLSGQVGAGVAIERRVEAGLCVRADRQRLQQALLNLIKNGVDAVGGKGEVVIEARSLPEGAMALEGGGPRLVVGDTFGCSVRPVVEIVVRDTGPGIAPSVLPSIFDPFFTTKETGEGYGLGLFVTHEVVGQHGGCLVVESLPPHGATFRLLLPREEPVAEAGEFLPDAGSIGETEDRR
ncbi:MAG: HAMP domain-containing protein [Magnetococcales bacterium]|nr:HAMP domain-containing protein [Magnetococcales bacterium]MBF0156146.1 HAMP domain-containing protein [Magnetococcales bacterium]